MEIYEKIKQLRKELGLSAETVAEKIGISPATMYRYENNDIKKFPIDILKPLADVLHTTPSYIMGWSDDKVELSSLTQLEQEVISAYRSKPEMQEAVNTLLGISKPAAITNDSVASDINLLSQINQKETINKK